MWNTDVQFLNIWEALFARKCPTILQIKTLEWFNCYHNKPASNAALEVVGTACAVSFFMIFIDGKKVKLAPQCHICQGHPDQHEAYH